MSPNASKSPCVSAVSERFQGAVHRLHSRVLQGLAGQRGLGTVCRRKLQPRHQRHVLALLHRHEPQAAARRQRQASGARQPHDRVRGLRLRAGLCLRARARAAWRGRWWRAAPRLPPVRAGLLQGAHEHCSYCGSPSRYHGSKLLHHFDAPDGGADNYSHCLACPVFSCQDSLAVCPSLLVMDNFTNCKCFPGHENRSSPSCSVCPPYMLQTVFSDNPCVFCAAGHYFVDRHLACIACYLAGDGGPAHRRSCWCSTA